MVQYKAIVDSLPSLAQLPYCMNVMIFEGVLTLVITLALGYEANTLVWSIKALLINITLLLTHSALLCVAYVSRLFRGMFNFELTPFS
jgi:hypothetical protein